MILLSWHEVPRTSAIGYSSLYVESKQKSKFHLGIAEAKYDRVEGRKELHVGPEWGLRGMLWHE